MPARYGSLKQRLDHGSKRIVYYSLRLNAYLTVFQGQIRHASQGRRLSFCELLVDLINPIRYVIESLVEQVASVAG